MNGLSIGVLEVLESTGVWSALAILWIWRVLNYRVSGITRFRSILLVRLERLLGLGALSLGFGSCS